MRKISEIIVHCTATPVSMKVTVADIDRWHRQRGFDGIGYHYVIMQDGTVRSGRPVERVGAHCHGHNEHSIGVCYVGGLDDECRPCDTRTDAQKDALQRTLKALLEIYPGATVHGHREFAAKDCPCYDV